jgi:hypothetical protein
MPRLDFRNVSNRMRSPLSTPAEHRAMVGRALERNTCSRQGTEDRAASPEITNEWTFSTP